jgi:Mg2+/citrate symporter
MLILGLLLVVLSGVAAAVLIAYNSGGTAETVSVFGRDIADVNLVQAFVAGIVVALVFLIGLAMIMKAGRRGRENRARYREARREAKTAAAERDELAEKLHKDEEYQATHQPTQPMQTQAPAQAPVQQPGQQPTQPVDDTTGTGARHAAPDQPVITNIRPGQPPSR